VSGRVDPFAIAGTVRLERGREVVLRRRHPWVYRGALVGAPPPRGAVAVLASDGAPLGTALVAAGEGSLALRMVAWPGETWSAAFLRRRLAEAAGLRTRLAIDSDAYRLVHAEGDLLPGLVIDRYGAVAVVEVFDGAWEPYLPEIAAFLSTLPAAADAYPTVLLRRGEGRRGEVAALRGELPTAPIEIREGAVRLPVDLVAGHKTGFYLDQRDNRRRLGELAADAEVLNLFSYSGGFAVAALAGGARRAVNVDASDEALALARTAYRINGHAVRDEDFVTGDAFEVTRRLAAAGGSFGVVVVDPPSFVRRRSELAGGLRGVKDVNLQALKLVASGGLLLTCSCSALLDQEAFAGALAAAAVDAGRTVRVLEVRGAAPDHPVALACSETRHLQAWLCHVS
jgi:23S rRNA (cytosine1962-C5)-methyltransferase